MICALLLLVQAEKLIWGRDYLGETFQIISFFLFIYFGECVFTKVGKIY